jgi:hypothetical protein
MMGEKSDQHGPRLDDELRHETEGLVRGTGPTHAEPGNDPEPVETDAGRDPIAPLTGRDVGAPPGMSPNDVETRSAYAKVLAGVRYPATSAELAASAAGEGAPDPAVRALETLPDRSYGGLPEVVEALGLGHEEDRT